MKKNIMIYIVVLIFGVLTSGVYASGQDHGTASGINAIDRISEKVQEYFSPVHGKVMEEKDGIARITFDSNAGIQKGMRFSVFREGTPFYHPVTNELLGKSEDFTGRVEAIQTGSGKGDYLCTIVEGGVAPGDIVRITSSKIKLAFFQERNADWPLSELLHKTLKDSGRFDMLESYTATYEQEHLSALGRELGADAVLLFATPVKNRNKFMNVKLFWPKDAKMFGDIEAIVSEDIEDLTKPFEVFLSAAGAGTEPWGSFQLGNGRLIAMGDVDGNGSTEIVVSDDNDIKVYSLRDEIQELWHIKSGRGGVPLSIDILDVNGNGKAEIFVTSLVDDNRITSKVGDDKLTGSDRGRGRLSSYVVEYNSADGYIVIAEDMPYFMRVMGNTLLMQKYSSRNAFSGPVYEADWQEGGYKTKKALNLPDKVNIYGFTYVDWNNTGHRNVISYDDRGYITMYDGQGNSIWESDNTYGKFDMSFEKSTYSLANPLVKWTVRGRLITVKTERGQEIIVVNNLPFVSRMPGLGSKGAEVHSLWWDGSTMDEQLVLSDLSGAITDFRIEGGSLFLVAKGNMITLVKNAVTGEFVKGSILYYYKFGKQ